MNAAKKNIKTLAPVLIVFLTLILLMPNAVFAQAGLPSPSLVGAAVGAATKGVAGLLGLSNIAGSVIAWVAYVINYLIATIAGVFIALITYFIEIILQLNTHVVEATMVKSGFGVVLALANLGFVLGIIVIAIATILRRETYGIKQILWKLIVMAILVNFSLVIASAILSFADQLALYFLNSINPMNMPSIGAGPFDSFASSIAGAFNPQRSFTGISINAASGTAILGGQTTSLTGAAGQTVGGMLGVLVSIVFVVLFSILTVIVLASLLVMLLIRYIYLGLLLILMPLAWMCWVFPALSQYWQKWWHNFIKWTFFAPLVVFFLYLVIVTSQSMGGGGSGGIAGSSNDPAAAFSGLGYVPSGGVQGPFTAISALVGGFTNQIVGTILQMVLMLGLTIGGLFAANSMGITFAKTAYGAAQGVGKGFSGYVARKGGGVFARAATQPPPPAGASTWSKTKYALKSPLRWGARVLPPTGRAAIQNWGTWAATSPGWAASIWNGMRTGHGTYGPKRKAQWTCQSCIPLGYPSPTVITQPNRPTNDFTCTQCGQSTNGRRAALGNPTYQNWA
jgi:hypothetical protein